MANVFTVPRRGATIMKTVAVSTSSRPTGARAGASWSVAVALASGLCLSVILGCTSKPAGRTQRPVEGSAQSVPATIAPSSTPTVEEQVLAPYRSFWPLLAPVSATTNPDDKRRLLSPMHALLYY